MPAVPGILESFFRAEEHEGERRINVLRNAALLLLYVNEMVNYHLLGAVDYSFHYSVTVLTAGYALAAGFYWWLVNCKGYYHRASKYAAMLADVTFLTFMLAFADGPSSALVSVYYLLIAFTALRYNWRAALTCAVYSACAYLALQIHAVGTRPELAVSWPSAVIQVLCLLLMGLASGRMVYMMRSLVDKFGSARLKQEKTEHALTRYVSRQVAEQIMGQEGGPMLEGRRVEATILMCDIRGFTPMSEKMDPVALMSLLNRYFEAMIRVIFRHDGTLDKFIGDAILVVFGAPLPQADMEARAVRCAAEMQKELSEFNAAQKAAGGPELFSGISVHCGPVVAGSVGSEMRLEYTVLGDVVNLTQRMQSKAGPGAVIVSEAVFAKTSALFSYQRLEPFSVKGRQELVQAHELLR